MLVQNLALTVQVGDFNFIKQSLRSHNNFKRHYIPSAVQMLWAHVLFKKSWYIYSNICIYSCYCMLGYIKSVIFAKTTCPGTLYLVLPFKTVSELHVISCFGRKLSSKNMTVNAIWKM